MRRRYDDALRCKIIDSFSYELRVIDSHILSAPAIVLDVSPIRWFTRNRQINQQTKETLAINVSTVKELLLAVRLVIFQCRIIINYTVTYWPTSFKVLAASYGMLEEYQVPA